MSRFFNVKTASDRSRKIPLRLHLPQSNTAKPAHVKGLMLQNYTTLYQRE